MKKFLETLEVEKCLITDQNSEISKVSVGSEKQDLRHFSTSSGSKNFFTGDMIALMVFKRLPEIRAFQRTSNRDITNRESETKLQKTRQRPNLVFQSQLRLSKFLSFGPFLRHFSTSGGSKKFSIGDMMTSTVFKRLP